MVRTSVGAVSLCVEGGVLWLPVIILSGVILTASGGCETVIEPE